MNIRLITIFFLALALKTTAQEKYFLPVKNEKQMVIKAEVKTDSIIIYNKGMGDAGKFFDKYDVHKKLTPEHTQKLTDFLVKNADTASDEFKKFKTRIKPLLYNGVFPGDSNRIEPIVPSNIAMVISPDTPPNTILLTSAAGIETEMLISDTASLRTALDSMFLRSKTIKPVYDSLMNNEKEKNGTLLIVVSIVSALLLIAIALGIYLIIKMRKIIRGGDVAKIKAATEEAQAKFEKDIREKLINTFRRQQDKKDNKDKQEKSLQQLMNQIYRDQASAIEEKEKEIEQQQKENRQKENQNNNLDNSNKTLENTIKIKEHEINKLNETIGKLEKDLQENRNQNSEGKLMLQNLIEKYYNVMYAKINEKELSSEEMQRTVLYYLFSIAILSLSYSREQLNDRNKFPATDGDEKNIAILKGQSIADTLRSVTDQHSKMEVNKVAYWVFQVLKNNGVSNLGNINIYGFKIGE